LKKLSTYTSKEFKIRKYVLKIYTLGLDF